MAVLVPASPALLEEISNETGAWQEPRGLCCPQMHCWCLPVCLHTHVVLAERPKTVFKLKNQHLNPLATPQELLTPPEQQDRHDFLAAANLW